MTPLCTVEEANSYFEDTLTGLDWASEDETKKLLALKQATKIINNLNFKGEVSVAGQENCFPRGGDTEIPQTIKEACADIALALIQGIDPNVEAEIANYTAQTFTSAKIEKAPARTPEWVYAGVPCQSAWIKLLRYLEDGMDITILRG